MLHQLYQSLLGALAFSLLTQHWIAIYVTSLQRFNHSSKNIHVRRLNAVVRALQKAPAVLHFPAMICESHLSTYADAAFSKEQDKGYGMRGAVHLRTGKCRKTGDDVHHLVQTECKSLKLVTRSSFSSETLGATGALDTLWPLALTLHELKVGTVTAAEAKRFREQGGLAVKTTLTLDALSVFQAVIAKPLKPPTEKNLAGHLYWIRELLDLGILTELAWCDTRDMIADALTKGKVDRDVLLEAMKGRFKLKHEKKVWRPLKLKTACERGEDKQGSVTLTPD
jgi:hypothetical protein